MGPHRIHRPAMDEPLISVAAIHRRIAALLRGGAAFDAAEVETLREAIDVRYGAYREDSPALPKRVV